MIAAVALFLGSGAIAAAGAGSANDEAAFDAAAKLYEGGRPAEAAAAYERLLTNGLATAAVYFNQGNAWLQAGKVGRAVVSYHRALALAPRDVEIAANLARARAKVGSDARTVDGFAVRALRLLTPNEWAALALGGVWLWFGVLGLGQLLPRRKAFFAAFATPLACVAIPLLGLAAGAGWLATQTVAVVVVADTTVRFGPLEESQTAFTLPDGAELVVTDRKGDWLGIRDGTGRRGWLMARNILTIR